MCVSGNISNSLYTMWGSAKVCSETTGQHEAVLVPHLQGHPRPRSPRASLGSSRTWKGWPCNPSSNFWLVVICLLEDSANTVEGWSHSNLLVDKPFAKKSPRPVTGSKQSIRLAQLSKESPRWWLADVQQQSRPRDFQSSCAWRTLNYPKSCILPGCRWTL